MNLATIEIWHKYAEIIYKSLIPEMRQNLPRTLVDISHSKSIVKIIIKAQDIHSLRACINSYLRWIKTIVEVLEVE